MRTLLRCTATALALVAAGLALTACGGGHDDDPATLSAAEARKACGRLAGASLRPDTIGLPTSGALVQQASYVAADAEGNANGPHCEVVGVITPVDAAAPNIQFQVNLPDRWNGKAVQFGGGAYDGVLVTGLTVAAMHPSSGDTPLKQGYMTLGSDSGHQSADANWALNDEALANFGHRQIKKTHDVAMALARRRYDDTPSRFYFVGNSQGGHEALDAAARYPDDYDGVVATHPAYNVPLLHLASLNVVQAGAANGGAGWLDPARHALVKDHVQAACDRLDGLEDHIIGNLAACRQRETIDRLRRPLADGGLRCAGGAEAGDDCLSDAELDAVERIGSDYRPGFRIAGASRFPAWGILEGADLPLGTRPVPAQPPDFARDSFFAVIAAYTVQYVFARNPDQDLLGFDPTAYKDRIQQVAGLMDVTDVDLRPFQRKGGKIIMTHGTADQLIAERNSEAYYERQRALFGQSTLDDFLRFYVIPGFAHGNGTFSARYDALTQLVGWVEQGQVPGSDFVTVDENADTAGRTRPMCLYGSYPRYRGGGADPDLAASFDCVANP